MAAAAVLDLTGLAATFARGRMATYADPDEDLVRRVGQGDPAAVQAMVARKLPRMLALAQRMLGDAVEAEDVAQETLLRAWRQAPRWVAGNSATTLNSACTTGTITSWARRSIGCRVNEVPLRFQQLTISCPW